MALTVQEVLQLEVFRRVEVQVLAGRDNLQRPVRWVHAGEIPDIARFLAGGEMLLTAGLGMGQTELDQRAYIRRIAAANAAVLVVELAGRVFRAMPAGVVAEAEALHLPLVGLSEEIPFVEVSAQVHQEMIENRVRELTADEAVSQAFEDLLLDGADYVSITGELSRRVGHPVVLEDMTHQVLTYAGRTPVADRIVTEWEAHSRVLHELQPPSPTRQRSRAREHVTKGIEYASCARRPVVLRGESWGWIHVLHGDADLSPTHGYALDRAAAAVAITLLSERASGARAAQRQGALVNRLLVGELSGEDFVHKALALGRDLRGHMLVVAAIHKNARVGEQTLDAALRAAKIPAVIADVGDEMLAVAGQRAGVEDSVYGVLARWGDIHAGLSRAVNPGLLAHAVRQARQACTVASTRGSPAVLRFDELGVLRLLVALAQGPELANYVEDELGALLRQDASSSNKLLPTLRSYLACDGNKSQAAEELFIQRRTLYNRLERLGSLLGASLDDPAVRQRLLLAVRGLDLLHRPTTHIER